MEKFHFHGLLGLVLILGCTGSQPNQKADSRARGLYLRHCATCHQMDGTGSPGVFPPLAASEWVQGNPSTLARLLLLGASGEFEVRGKKYSGAMPRFAELLTDEEISQILTYVRSNWGNKASSVEPAQVTAERNRYQSRKTPWSGGAELKASELQ